MVLLTYIVLGVWSRILIQSVGHRVWSVFASPRRPRRTSSLYPIR